MCVFLLVFFVKVETYLLLMYVCFIILLSTVRVPKCATQVYLYYYMHRWIYVEVLILLNIFVTAYIFKFYQKMVNIQVNNDIYHEHFILCILHNLK